MQDDFQSLPNILKLDPKSKLQIIGINLTKDLSIAIDLINMNEEEISKIIFSFKYRDLENRYLFDGAEFYFETSNISLPNNQVYYVKPFKLDQRFSEVRGLDVRIKSYTASGKEYTLDQNSENEYNITPINQSKREDFSEFLGKDIINYGENFISSWRCVCGIFNEKESSTCKHCNRNKNFILNNLTEPLINMKLSSFLASKEASLNLKKEKIVDFTQTKINLTLPNEKNLNTTRVNEELVNPNKKHSTFLNHLYFLLVLVGLGLAFFLIQPYIKDMKIKNEFDSAKALIADGQYEEAIKKLKNLNNHGNFEVEPLIQKAQILIKSKENFDLANNLILKEDYIKAIEKLKLVSDIDGLNFSRAQTKIDELENIILNNIEIDIELGLFDKALLKLEKYLKIVPESAKAQILLDFINTKKNQELILPLDKKINPNLENNTSPEESIIDQDDRAEMTKKAKSLINTYQTISKENSHLRANPSLAADIVTILAKGTEIYIEDTKIEGLERIWCQVQTKDPNSQDVFTGWISNKLFENE